ncbi:hypothetical protein Scep_007416 [Stephania cephalantha]|uniref:Uncharacterized protein n=1 Tax=Stephania cephalantha TaxID=152367 RepID=A0AAP0PN84_9MAGN
MNIDKLVGENETTGLQQASTPVPPIEQFELAYDLGINQVLSKQIDSLPIEESSPQDDLHQAANEPVAEGTRDNFIANHNDFVQDDVTSLEDSQDLVPLVNTLCRLKGNDLMIVRLSKKKKATQEFVPYNPLITEENSSPVATNSDSTDS